MASVSHAAATAAPSRTSYRHLFAFLLIISLLPPPAYAGVSPDEKTAEGRLPEEITENPETRAFLQQWKAEHGSSSGAKKEPPKMKPPKDEA